MTTAGTPRESGSKKRWMRVLGVDGRACRMLHYGALKLAGKTKNGDGAALREVHALLSQLIEDFAPDVMAVESIFSALNVRTALRLAEVRGVVLLAAAQHGLEVHSYAPREVKASIAGQGQADKRQIQKMVRVILAMEALPEPPDAADALAVALCHLQMEQARRRMGGPGPLEANAHAAGRATSLRPGRATPGGAPRILSA